MLQRIKQARETESGFTLVELLIVIVVLGILAGIVVFGVGTFRADATKSALCTNYKMVQTASEAYQAKTGAFATAVDGTATTTLVGGGYLKSAPSTAIAYDNTTGEATKPTGC